MTPKEKANELVQSFYNNQSSHSITSVAFNSAKRCALICVDEKFKSIKDSFGGGGNTKSQISIKLMKLSKAYKELLEVKQEINKI